MLLQFPIPAGAAGDTGCARALGAQQAQHFAVQIPFLPVVAAVMGALSFAQPQLVREIRLPIHFGEEVLLDRRPGPLLLHGPADCAECSGSSEHGDRCDGAQAQETDRHQRMDAAALLTGDSLRRLVQVQFRQHAIARPPSSEEYVTSALTKRATLVGRPLPDVDSLGHGRLSCSGGRHASRPAARLSSAGIHSRAWHCGHWP